MKDSQTPSTCFTAAPRRRLLERRLNGFGRIVGLVAAFSVPLSQVAWANTAVLVTNGTTDLTTLGAGTTSDLEFQNLTYSPTAFTLAGSNALSIGTLDDLDGSQSLTIANGAGSAGTITLNGGSNTVAPSASDLLYVTSGGVLTFTGGSGTTALGLALGTSNGNFDIAGSATIGSIISGAGNGFTLTGGGSLTLSGANTYTGTTTISSGTVNFGTNLNLGATSAPVSLNGGALNLFVTNGNFADTHVITVGASGGTLNVGGFNDSQVSFGANTLVGSGALTITGIPENGYSGTMVTPGGVNGDDANVQTTASQSYSGTITIGAGGSFSNGTGGSISSASFIVNAGGEMDTKVATSNAITSNGGLFGWDGAAGSFSGNITDNSGGMTVAMRDYWNSGASISGPMSGVISGAGGLTVVPGAYTGTGGTLTLSNADTYGGATSVNDTNLTVNGASGAIAGSSGYTVINGTLTLTYATATNNAMLNSSGNVTLGYGAGLTLTGVSATALTQSIGTLALTSGANTLTVTPTGTALAELNPSAFSRSSNATGLVLGASLGQSSSNATAAEVILGSASGLTQVGTNTLTGAATTDATLGLTIIPYLFGGASGSGSDFLTYDTVNGLRLLTSAEQTTLSAGYVTAASPDNAIAFNGTVTTSGVTLNSLLFSTASQTLNGSGTLTINSGAIAATAATEVIGSGFGGLILGNGTWNEGVITAASGDTLTINTPISVTGGGGLTKTGAGTLALGVAAAYTGQTTINQGTLSASVNNVLNGSPLVVNNGGTFSLGTTTQAITTLGLTGNGTVSGGAGSVLNLGGTVTYNTSGAASALTGGATISAATLNLNGTDIFNIGQALVDENLFGNNASTDRELTISSAVVNGSATGGITKNGNGILVLTGAANTYSGPTTINGGTFYLLGTSTQGVPDSAITVNNGATLAAQVAVNNVAETMGASLTMNGGNALMGTVDNPGNAAGRQNTYKFTGALTLGQGANTIAINNTQFNVYGSEISFGSVSRTAGATVLFRGEQLGTNTLLSNANLGPDGIVFTTAPTGSLVGGAGAITTTTTSIIPWAIGDQGTYQGSYYQTYGLGTDFVTYGANGVELLQNYATSITSGASNSNNVKVTDTTLTGINAGTTINSLILNSAAASLGYARTSGVNGTGTLNITSGALMVTTTSPTPTGSTSNPSSAGGLYTNNATIGAGGLTLAFGAAEAIITTAGSSTLTMASTSGGITGSGGLTKSGAGTLNLNAADTISGNTIIDAGSIVLGNANALQDSILDYGNFGGSLSFGTLTAATVGGLTGSQNLSLNNTGAAAVALTVNYSGAGESYSGILSGNGSLTNAAGALTLSGANTYAGTTTINGGTLNINGSTAAGSAVSVNNGGTLGGTGTIGGTVAVNAGGTLGGTGTITGAVTVAGGTAGTPSTQGTINLDNGSATATLTLNGGLTIGGGGSNISQLTLEAKGASAADKLAITGALTLNAGGADITINNLVLNSGNNTYTLATFSGAGTYNATNGSGGTAFATGSGVSIDGFTLTDPNLAFGITGMLDVTAASNGALELVTTGAAAPASAYWSGAQGTTWGSNSGGNGNFTTTLDGGTFVSALPGSTTAVYFSDNGSTNLTNTLGSNFDIASLTFLGSTNHNGAVTINADGNTLTLESGGLTVQSGAGAVTVGSLVALNASQVWANASSNNLTVSGAISGGSANGLTINNTGSGAVVLGGANTFSGATTITAGTLQLSSSNALQNSTLTDSGNNDLVFTGGIGTFTLGGLSGSGNEVLEDLSSSPVTLQVGNNGAGTTYSGALSDSGNGGGLTKIGSGTLILAGANTYSGATTVSGGTLNLTGSVTGSSVTTSGTGIVNESSTGVIAGSGATFTQGSTGTSILAGANTYGGLTTVNAGGTLQIGAGGTTGSLGSAGVTDNGILAFDRTDTYGGSLSNVIGGTGAVNVAAGTLTLTGANTYSGGTTIGSTAALTISGGGTLGSGAIYGGNIFDGGTFTYASSASQTLSGLISQGGALIDNGTGTLTLTVVDSYTGGTTVNSGATLSLDTDNASGNVQGTITVNSGGTVLLSAVNALGYTSGVATAAVNVNGGTLSNNVNGLESMGGSTSFVLTGGSVVNGVGFTGSLDFDFTGSGGITTNASSTTSTWSVPIYLRSTTVSMPIATAAGSTPSGIDLNISGGIGQAAAGSGITKSGAGTLELSGADTYTGATTVSQGTLIVAGSLSSSIPSVSSGAHLEADGTVTDAASVSGELSGTGSVGGASVTGGTLAPGLSLADSTTAVGTLTANGNVTLASSSIFSIRIGLTNGLSNDADQLSMGSSTFSLADGTTTLQTIDGAAEGNVSLQNTVYTIVSGGWSGGDGFFENADSQGAQFTDAQGYTYAVFYGVASGSTVTAGNDINLELVAVPEPQTWAMLLGGAAMLLLPRRSRRWNRSKN